MQREEQKKKQPVAPPAAIAQNELPPAVPSPAVQAPKPPAARLAPAKLPAATTATVAPKAAAPAPAAAKSAAPKTTPAAPKATAKAIGIGDVIDMFSSGVPEEQISAIIQHSPAVQFDALDKDTAIAIAKAKLPVSLQNEMRKRVGAPLLTQLPAKPATAGTKK